MADVAKYQPINGSELRSLFSVVKTRRTVTFAYGCMLAFVLFTIFLAFAPSPNPSSPRFLTVFSSSAIAPPTSDSYRSQFSDLFGYFFPNSSIDVKTPKPTNPNPGISDKGTIFNLNQTSSGAIITAPFTPEIPKPRSPPPQPAAKKQRNGDLMNCKLYDGDWVKDESYPLYKPGSCLLIDPQFSCISNGRPDMEYLKYKWKPNACSLPRLDANRMLNMLRGKRLVFVGDSLNRNMWESMVCILRNAAKNQSKVFEANGRHHFRGEAEYSFVFKDYNFTVEFYVSPFLVQEWEVEDKSGVKKETLRLDLIGKSFDDYKSADILIFNTGHWWTHEKTSLGKGYYQEGSHVYGELNVLEAFRKALTTWARWVDANINPINSAVFFRGYSASHFSGGQWNSGGACDSETQPIKNHSYLAPYPPKMMVLEKVLKNMKTPVSYLNITQLTDFRKDGHPSIYRNKDLPGAAPLQSQDCSHWCLPGVPDAWNELLYAELLIREHQNRRK